MRLALRRSSLVIVREGDSVGRHLQFIRVTVSADEFYPVTIIITCAKIHVPINARPVRAQRLLDDTLALDKLPPIHRIQKTQAADRIPDGHLRGGLVLA